MVFENKQIFEQDLPSIEGIQFKTLEKNYLRVLYLSKLIGLTFFIVLFIVLYLLAPEEIPSIYFFLPFLLALLFFIVFILFTKSAFKVKSFGIRQHDILYKSGLIFRTTTIIPFNRVQHVEIKTGPIDRSFGLASLKIYTAGGSQSDLNIPGLNPEMAQKVKELIINKTAMDEEE
jgi:membrane protein YdbS with pleckstrin-like domain